MILLLIFDFAIETPRCNFYHLFRYAYFAGHARAILVSGQYFV